MPFHFRDFPFLSFYYLSVYLFIIFAASNITSRDLEPFEYWANWAKLPVLGEENIVFGCVVRGQSGLLVEILSQNKIKEQTNNSPKQINP